MVKSKKKSTFAENTRNMKKIISIILTLFASVVFFAAGAQTVFDGGKLFADGQQLTKENAAAFLSAPLAERYAKALSAEKVGSVLAYTGGGVALVSGAVWGISEFVMRNRDSDIMPTGWGIGIAGMIIGTTIATSGLVTYLVGRNQVRLIGAQASASSQAELDFGFTPSGIGLALNF